MSPRLRRTVLARLAAVAALAAACSQSPAGTSPGGTAGSQGTLGAATPAPASAQPTPGAAAGPRACDLLSDEDIQELGSVAVVSKEDDVLDTVYGNHCRWTLEVGEINLGVVGPGGRDFYETRVAIINGLEPVEGLPADIATRDDLTGSIFAVRGDTFIDVFTIAVGASDESLATRVLENLE